MWWRRKRRGDLVEALEARIAFLQEELDRVTAQREEEKIRAQRWKWEAEDGQESAQMWQDSWTELVTAIGRSGYDIAYRPIGYEQGEDGTTTAMGQQTWIVPKEEGSGG